MRTFWRIVYGRLAQHAARLQGNGQRIGRDRTFGLAEVGRSGAATLLCQTLDGRGGPVTLLGLTALVLASEAIVDSYANVAAQGWETDGVLILLVQDVGGAGVERNAAAEVVAAGDIEAGIAGISRLS